MEISRRTYGTSLSFGSFLCRAGLLHVGRPPRSQSSYRHVVFFAVQIPFILLVLPSFAWRTMCRLLVSSFCGKTKTPPRPDWPTATIQSKWNGRDARSPSKTETVRSCPPPPSDLRNYGMSALDHGHCGGRGATALPLCHSCLPGQFRSPCTAPYPSSSHFRLKLLDLRKRKAGEFSDVLQREHTALQHPLRRREHGLALAPGLAPSFNSFHCFAHIAPPFF